MIDLTFLKQFSKDDSKKMRRYIHLYLDVAPKTFEDMEINLKNKDWEQLRIHAHSLKPQADFMGIKHLKEALINIEESVKNNHLEGIEEMYQTARQLSVESEILLRDALEQLE
jgi:HPt (histidine-containing phosphotransfer) domain-containing protein